ncbi:MAG: hypothetical protein JWM86_2822 [Thermoleophilia bacterium]|nr:hypothetical protein [Thermoleophilia bacterium]
MLADFIAAAKDQLGSLGSPLIDTARQVQAQIAAATPESDRAGSDATTVDGHLATGPRPTADAVRSAALRVPGEVDHERARADAERTLASLDFSRPDLVLWVPATGSHTIPADWQRATTEQFGDRASLALVDYPAATDFNDSVSTGQETLRLVLAGIAERGGEHRVSIAGHSQGAWVIGDRIADPTIGRMVDRAILYGHPAPARVDWSRSGDPRVRQVDHPDDPFTWDVTGGHQALAAIDEIRDGRGADGHRLEVRDTIQRGLTVAATALVNPALAAYLVGQRVTAQSWEGTRDPHHYTQAYGSGAGFLAA